jgi:5-methylcytosine-specific restriction endonuclease McrA
MALKRSRKARADRRRRRRKAAVVNDLTDDQWLALRQEWGGCAYCGASSHDLQRDCVIALSRGGRYTLANVVPACSSCNASKSNDEVTSWMRRKRLDESGFLMRHHDIVTRLTAAVAPDGGPTTDEPSTEVPQT